MVDEIKLSHERRGYGTGIAGHNDEQGKQTRRRTWMLKAARVVASFTAPAIAESNGLRTTLVAAPNGV